MTPVTCPVHAPDRDLRHAVLHAVLDAGCTDRYVGAATPEETHHGLHTVLYEVSDGLATITLNRPEAMNAMNTETKVALRDAAQAAAADGGVRAILLTAAGDRAFCVGQDLKEHIGLLAADKESGSRHTMSTVREHYNPIGAVP